MLPRAFGSLNLPGRGGGVLVAWHSSNTVVSVPLRLQSWARPGVSNCSGKGIPRGRLGDRGHGQGHHGVPGTGIKWREQGQEGEVPVIGNGASRTCRELKGRGVPGRGGIAAGGGRKGNGRRGRRGGSGAGPCQGAAPGAWRRGCGDRSLCTYRKAQRHRRCQCPCEEKTGAVSRLRSPVPTTSPRQGKGRSLLPPLALLS